MLSVLTVDTSFIYLAIVNAVRMLGTAIVIMPVTTAALNQLPQRLSPHGTALNNTLRQIAAPVGTATLVTVMTAAPRDPQEYGPQRAVHAVSGALASAGVIGALFIRDSRPQASEAEQDWPRPRAGCGDAAHAPMHGLGGSGRRGRRARDGQPGEPVTERPTTRDGEADRARGRR